MRSPSFRVLQLAAAMAMVASAALGAEVAKLQEAEVLIKACKPQNKPEAGHLDFATSVRYLLNTDASGQVVDAVEDPASITPPIMWPEFQTVQACLKSWRLQPSLTYNVELGWGTTASVWSWRVCPPANGKCINVVVPR